MHSLGSSENLRNLQGKSVPATATSSTTKGNI
jgi:hypothetical protein